jgi:hypothetical protein
MSIISAQNVVTPTLMEEMHKFATISHACTSIYTHIHVQSRACVQWKACVCTYCVMFVCVCVYWGVCVCVCVCVYACMNIHTHAHIHTYTYTCIHTHTYREEFESLSVILQAEMMSQDEWRSCMNRTTSIIQALVTWIPEGGPALTARGGNVSLAPAHVSALKFINQVSVCVDTRLCSMHTCMCVLHTCMCAAYICSICIYKHTYIHTYIHAYIYTYIHTPAARPSKRKGRQIVVLFQMDT